MFILGLGTATPAKRYTQQQCWESAKSNEQVARLAPRSQALLRKLLLGDNGIQSRCLALDTLHEAFTLNPDALHARFAQHAPALAEAASRTALAQATAAPAQIDALIISTCTGYLCPGLTSYVAERLGLRRDALLLDLVGQGCGAALPNLRTAEALLLSQRAGHVLSVCVEVCSAAFYLDDDPGVLVSACLFGDGAGAAVLSLNAPVGQRRVQWLNAATRLSATDRDTLRFEQKDGMLRNILSKQVPELAGQHAHALLGEMLSRAQINQDQVRAWILHAGGKSILSALSGRLGLTEHDVRWSAGVLREYGNLSSPCVLFVLQAALSGAAPPGLWWMSSFGAGFSCHGALLQVQ